jgi:ribosomal protein L34E
MIKYQPQLLLVCDTCGFYLEAVARDVDQARLIGSFKGWTRRFGRDLCPACVNSRL